MRAFLTLALLATAFAACDVVEEDDDVYVVDFSFDRDSYSLSEDGTTASFESDDIESGTDRAALREALRTAGDGAVVVAYVQSDFLTDAENTNQTYTPLPTTRAFRQDGLETVLTYEYSFDNEDFYFDVVSSDPAGDFGEGALFNFAIARDPQLRIVTIPATVFQAADVNVADYAAVQAAFDLPE